MPNVYEVGDNVRVLNSNEGLENVWPSFLPDMVSTYSGLVMTVSRTNTNYEGRFSFSLENTSYIWGPEFVEPADPQNMRPGMIATVHRAGWGFHPDSIGQRVRISAVVDDHSDIRYDCEGNQFRIHWKSFEYQEGTVVPESPIEHVPPPPPKNLYDTFNMDLAVDAYCRVNCDSNSDVVAGIMKDIISIHKDLNTSLGLNAENGYRKVIEVEKSHKDIFEAYKNESAVVYFLVQAAGGNPLTIDLADFTAENSKGQRQKIGRMIRRVITDSKYLAIASNYTPENFIPHFRELIAKQSGVVISTNPLDLLTPSDYATFSSCHKVQGEYSLSPLFNAFCPDHFQAIMFEDTQKKSGRTLCWAKDETFYFNGGRYGTFGEIEEKSVIQYIGGLFSLSKPSPTNVDITYGGAGTYHDGCYDVLGHESCNTYDTDVAKPPRCPHCGEEIDCYRFDDYARGACCYDCTGGGDDYED